ncbi:MAG: excinuclease ABC subunit A [Bdellovibrio sp.]|nr:MAG: excinuclease ABC subunit A [Bdellovibrio sp.]
MKKCIHLWGARQNILKNIELKIPLGSFTVICGPSGSGKSSLAFETLYAEGQRRYIESLSNYTKQFLNKAPKPDLDGIENVPPSLALDQKNQVRSSRSTVGTTTEILDYMRLIFEKAGVAFCPTHGVALEKKSPLTASQKVLDLFEKKRGYVLAPVKWDSRVTKKAFIQQLIKEGFLRVYVPSSRSTSQAPSSPYLKVTMGKVLSLSKASDIKSLLPKKSFFLVIDRLEFSKDHQSRLVDSLSQAYQASLSFDPDRTVAEAFVLTVEGDQILFSEAPSCSVCGYVSPPISAHLFSFNSPVGACPHCRGFGNVLEVDEAKVIPDPHLTLAQGAIRPFAMPSGARDRRALRAFCKKEKIDMHTPWEKLPAAQRKKIWEGTKDFFGVKGLFEYLETKKYKMHVRVFLARHKSPVPCPVCKGTRLRPEALLVKLNGLSIADYASLPVEKLYHSFKNMKFSASKKKALKEPLDQMLKRLEVLMEIGLGYLTLDRPTKTLSGGEYQRINLSHQLGTALSQTLYVLDEPTVGLHPRDNDRLINVLKKLNQLGNTLVVVEHDPDVIQSASYIVELGPYSGVRGGEIVFSGPIQDFYKCNSSLTRSYLLHSEKALKVHHPRPIDMRSYKYMLRLSGCSGHNLKNIDVRIPLRRIVTVTGVSGSGKSSLVAHTLYPLLLRELKKDFKKALPCKKIKGVNHLKDVLFIDQSPVGKTARSNPVTYLKIYDAIRNLMASTKEAQDKGYHPRFFSLNVEGGRCPVCKGMGYEVVDMVFMDDMEVPCEACHGKRFRPEVLEIRFQSKNIAEILDMTVVEAMEFFVSYPALRRPLALLKEVGLEYIRLGQSARSLSGGESQRLKVAKEIYSSKQKNTLYILDEPTKGLHFSEVQMLMKVLHRLVDGGGSVLMIEHNLEVIHQSDYIIDLGPEAGEKGGEIVVAGTPDKVMRCSKSLTGKYLKKYRMTGAFRKRIQERTL